MRRLSSVVTVPAQGVDLTTLAEVHREYDIRTSADDVYLQRQITRASQAIASYCRRVFARQTYLDTFHSYWRWSGPPASRMALAHWPVIGIDTVDVNGVEITDYDVDLAAGRLIRTACWEAGVIEVSYIAGYTLPGWPLDSGGGDPLPADVEQAAIQMVNANRQAGRLAYTSRDPFLRSETVEGVGTLTYGNTAIGSTTAGAAGAIPPAIRDLLGPYRVLVGTE